MLKLLKMVKVCLFFQNNQKIKSTVGILTYTMSLQTVSHTYTAELSFPSKGTTNLDTHTTGSPITQSTAHKVYTY